MLLTRRPDLPYIKLNCENTNTELPYVDLVNEILEGFVVWNGSLETTVNGVIETVAHNTPASATAAELSVNPEYTNDDAYNRFLNSAFFPPTLPYDRWLDTVRTYLNFLGGNLYQIMAACQIGASSSDFTKGSPSGIAIACEFLSISAAECVILTGIDFSGKAASLRAALAILRLCLRTHQRLRLGNDNLEGSELPCRNANCLHRSRRASEYTRRQPERYDLTKIASRPRV